MFVAEALKGTWYQAFADTDVVGEIKPSEHLIAYEFPPDLSASTIVLPVYHVQDGVPFGVPTLIAFDVDHPPVALTKEVIEQAVVTHSARWHEMFFGVMSHASISTVSLRHGRSTDGFTAPAPLSPVYGGSEPVEWASRSGAGVVSLEPLDLLVVEWNTNIEGHTPFTEDELWAGLRLTAPNRNGLPSSPPNTSDSSQPPSGSKIPLSACLNALTSPETLTSWYCSACHTHPPSAQRLFSIWSTPDILVIHLKRFSNAREKITEFVEYPVTGLDLGDEAVMYDLYAVSEHEGTGLGSGHYRAYALNAHEHGEKWYHYADARVKPARIEDVVVCLFSLCDRYCGLTLRWCQKRLRTLICSFIEGGRRLLERGRCILRART